jgi:hypothetical protein
MTLLGASPRCLYRRGGIVALSSLGREDSNRQMVKMSAILHHRAALGAISRPSDVGLRSPTYP